MAAISYQACAALVIHQRRYQKSCIDNNLIGNSQIVSD